MAKHWRRVIPSVIALAIVTSSGIIRAEVYQVERITHIYANSNGDILLKWKGSPSPGPCGENNGWVAIPADVEPAIKSMALATYYAGMPARIDTSGCAGTRERVGSLYSPSG